MITYIDLRELDPFSSGKIHGEKAKELIEKNVITTCDRFRRAGIEKETAKAEAILWSKKCSPEYLAECHGIAVGCGLELIDIFMLNFRIEIAQPRQAYQLMKMPTKKVDIGVPECTLFSIRDDNGTVMATGQNLDGLASVGGCLVVTKKNSKCGTIISVQEAGVVGTSIGFSSNGFSLVYAGLIMESCTRPRNGLPVRAYFHEILNKDSFTEVLSYISSSSPPCAIAAVLTSARENKVIVSEFLEEGVTIRHSSARVETHANHATMPSEYRSLFERHLPDSEDREKRLKYLLKDNENDSIDLIKHALGDHENYPTSICLHSKENILKEKKAATLCGAIIDWRTYTLHLSYGQPCRNEWSSFNVT